jgi:uncharacterized protein YukE
MLMNVNSATIDQVARELDRIAADISQGREHVRTAGNDAQNAWQSRLTGQFVQSVTTTQNRINACVQNIRLLASSLRSTAAAVRRAELEAARMRI